jgi:ribonuclease BN (tRNA processing enzyme)
MKITILGSDAAYAGKNGACSSYLLSSGEKNYIIETGPGCVAGLQNYIPIHKIKGIFLSHLHADHVSDIYTLRYAVYVAQLEGKMDPPLSIYMPNRPGKTHRFIKNTIKSEFAITHITDKLILDLNGMHVSFYKTRHALPGYAIRFNERIENETAVKSLVYTSDTSFFEGLVLFSMNADLLLAEATFQNSDKNLVQTGHMTAEKAGELAENTKARKLILTHIWPEYEKRISVDEAKRTYRGEIIPAERGQEFQV